MVELNKSKAGDDTKRRFFEILRAQLEIERSSFLNYWRELGEFILPMRPRFTLTEANRGERRNQKIIDSTGTLAARTLRSGMMAGITSPSRNWSRLTTSDPDLAEVESVRAWLHLVNQRMHSVFIRSNLYNSLPIVYGDMGTFATGAMMVEEDFDSVIRTYVFPVGSYMIANDDKGRVRVFFREFRMTIRQLVQKFGRKDDAGEIDWSVFSEHVQNQYKDGHMETWIDVCHVIQPNPDFDPDKAASRYKRFQSCYYEKGFKGSEKASYLRNGDDDKYLRTSGYDFFPVLVPRWEVTGEDVYGTSCPGMESLGDIKQLQTGEKRAGQAIELLVRPPMKGPSALRSTKTSILPGDVTYTDERDGTKGFTPVFQIDPKIQELELKQQQVRQRISRAYYEDLFLMLAQSDRREITAREIEERHEEKMVQLGPVLEQLNQDLLDPLIDITFHIMNRQRLIPPPPPELEGMELKVEYLSVMAQAQKLVGIGSIERFFGFVGNIASQTGDMSVIDKVDLDQGIDRYADRLGIDPDIVRPDEKVAAIRKARAQAQQQAVQAEQIATGAKAARDLAGADMEGDNALKRLAAGAA